MDGAFLHLSARTTANGTTKPRASECKGMEGGKPKPGRHAPLEQPPSTLKTLEKPRTTSRLHGVAGVFLLVGVANLYFFLIGLIHFVFGGNNTRWRFWGYFWTRRSARSATHTCSSAPALPFAPLRGSCSALAYKPIEANNTLSHFSSAENYNNSDWKIGFAGPSTPHDDIP